MIKYVKVDQAMKQVYLAKQDAIVYFGYTNHANTFQKLLKEFKEHRHYGKGYILATYGIPIVRIDLFEQFLIWRDENKYKR